MTKAEVKLTKGIGTFKILKAATRTKDMDPSKVLVLDFMLVFFCFFPPPSSARPIPNDSDFDRTGALICGGGVTSNALLHISARYPARQDQCELAAVRPIARQTLRVQKKTAFCCKMMRKSDEYQRYDSAKILLANILFVHLMCSCWILCSCSSVLFFFFCRPSNSK